jgi:hypothetical protein
MKLGRKAADSAFDEQAFDARTRAFSEALHAQLAECPTLDHKYYLLLYLSATLGGYASETQAQHEAAVEAIGFARQMLDDTAV